MNNEEIQPVEPAGFAVQGIVTACCLGAVLWVVIIAVVQWMRS